MIYSSMSVRSIITYSYLTPHKWRPMHSAIRPLCIECTKQPSLHAVDSAQIRSPNWESATAPLTCQLGRSTDSHSRWSETGRVVESLAPIHSRVLGAMDADEVSDNRRQSEAVLLVRRLAPCKVALRLCSMAGAVSTSRFARNWPPFR